MKNITIIIMSFFCFAAFPKSPIRLSSQEVMINKLKNAFIHKEEGLEKFNQIIDLYITGQPQIFGHSCDPYSTVFNHEGEIPSGATTEYFRPQNPETLCKTTSHLGFKSDYSPTSLRLISVTNVCMKLIMENEVFLSNFQQNVCKSKICQFDRLFIQRAYKKFNPIHSLDDDQLTEIYKLLKGEDPLESIRKLTISICLDPVWQTL